MAPLVAAIALSLLPVPVLAHAWLVTADPAPGSLLPAPPAAVALRFSEPVTAAGNGITIVAPSGRTVGAGRVQAAGPRLRLPFHAAGDGTYLIRWQVIAADTHPSRGQFTFSLGHSSTPPASEDLGADVGAVSPAGLLLQGLARWMHFVGLALGFGVVAFRLLALPEARPDQARRIGQLMGLGAGLLLLAEPVALAAQAMSLGVLAGDLLASSFGRILGLRTGGAILLWAAGAAIRETGRGWTALLGLGGCLCLVDGIAGHSVAGLPYLAGLVLSGVHEAAMALWIGGLAAALAVREGAAFTRVAAVSLAVLALSGLAMALAHLRGPADLVSSAYGLVLAAKVLAVTVVVAVGLLGRRRLEGLALAGVLALAGLLVSLPPPR